MPTTLSDTVKGARLSAMWDAFNTTSTYNQDASSQKKLRCVEHLLEKARHHMQVTRDDGRFSQCLDSAGDLIYDVMQS